MEQHINLLTSLWPILLAILGVVVGYIQNQFRIKDIEKTLAQQAKLNKAFLKHKERVNQTLAVMRGRVTRDREDEDDDEED